MSMNMNMNYALDLHLDLGLMRSLSVGLSMHLINYYYPLLCPLDLASGRVDSVMASSIFIFE